VSRHTAINPNSAPRICFFCIGVPIFVGQPNVTIAGEGTGTRIGGTPSVFILGIKSQYPQAITAAHYPQISGAATVLDNSVKGPKYGLQLREEFEARKKDLA